MDDFNALQQTIRQQQNRYWGKYRAFVADNTDPQKLGRCRLVIPSVLGETLSDWALPVTPYGGAGDEGFLMVPPLDAQVVAEFMEGDISSPLWTGSFWRSGGTPPAEYEANDTPTAKILKTGSGHLLHFEDKEGEETITLRSATDAVIEMNAGGSISLTDSGGATVVIDAEANEIRIEDANGNSVIMSGSGMEFSDASGNTITTEAGGVTVQSGATITLDGSMVAVAGSGGEPLIKGSSFLAAFNAHTHNCTAPGSPSGPPVPPLTPSVLTMKSTAQ